ncbi:hypothetical protein, partial [Mycoplasma phocimorsus]|uniref:hypothetical protein n=1 Tax=Mycoplasma phocimorsus TaxID=3045839 RepID=UPI0024BFC7D8
LVAGGVIGAGIYLFKYNRDPLHKTKAYFTDLAFKTYLKYKNIDVDFEDSFKNLIFYLYKENDQENKKLIDFLLGKVKEIIFDKKDINSFINKEEIEGWVKDFAKNEKSDIQNNPISYFIEILKDNNGEKILEELLKLLKTVSDKKDKFKTFPGFSDINAILEQPENAEGILSGVTSIIARFGTIKNSIDFIVIKGKEYLHDEKMKGILTIWVEFINILREKINKNKFKKLYKEQLKTLYILFYNVIKIFFKNITFSIPNSNGFLGSVFSFASNLITKTFKITNIITPNTIKEWIENKDNKINES